MKVKQIATEKQATLTYLKRELLRITKITSRHNQGFLSAAEIAKEFITSYSRVCRMLHAGEIKGKYDRKRNRWDVDSANITQGIIGLLSKPKETHKTWPTDKGDYYTRYGLCRRIIDGRVIVVAATERSQGRTLKGGKQYV